MTDTAPVRRADLPPGPRLPYAVQGLRMLYAPEAFSDSCRRRYGDTYTLGVPRRPVTVWSSDPALARLVTRLPDEASTAAEWNAAAEFLWGPRSPFVVEGEEHRRTRRLVMPVLRGPRVLARREEIGEAARRAAAGWSREGPVRLLEEMRALVLELMVRSVLGPGAGPVSGPGADPLASRVARLTETLRRITLGSLLLPWTRHVPGSAYGRVLRARRELAGCLEAASRARAGEGGGPGLLGDLVRARADGRLAGDALADQLIAFLLGGYATTATALASAFDLLLHHPAALERAEDEAAGGEGGEEGGGPWLEAVVRESLRLSPPAWVFGRVLREPVEFGRWRLPAGAWVAFDVLEMHRRADALAGLGGDPGAFRPERHLARAADGRRCTGAVPSWHVFGGGGRVCPGASFAPFVVRTVLAAVLARVRLRPLRDRPGTLVRESTLLVVRDGVPVTVSDR
ncbi:cytochrome P450 [Streptomyces glaucosporus]|uniref:Cytochrome P450 n=1 Tax=Streptomyces glaucosporus TaxID=284044 RepID=A0ABP5VTA2_9ACTN